MHRLARIAKVAGKVVGYTLLGVVSLVAVILATVFIGIRTQAGARLAVRVGLGITSKILAAEITVGSLKTNLWSGLELDDVEMRDTGGELAASIHKLRVRFSVLPLLGKTLRISSVRIEGARGRVRSLPNGLVNFAALLKPSVPTPPRPDTPASTFRVEINDVVADVDGLYEGPPAVHLPPIEGHIQVTGNVGIGGGDVRVGIGGLNVSLNEPGMFTLAAHGGLLVRDGNVSFDETQLSITTAGATLKPFVARPEIRGKYHIDVDAKGPLTALDLVANVETPSKPVHVDGQLQIGDTFGWRAHVFTRNLDPELIVAGAPHALVWLDAKGSQNASGIAFNVAHAQVEAEDNRVHVAGKAMIGKSITADADVEIAAHNLAHLKGRGLPKLAGSAAGLAKVHWSASDLRVDADLAAKQLVVPGARVRQLAIQAHTRNLGGHMLITARDVFAGAVELNDSRVELDGDNKTFLLSVGAVGGHGTSVDLALRGTPRYEEGPIPAGISAIVNALDVDRNGERWRVESGALIAYDKIVSVERFRARSQKQSLAIDAHVDLADRKIIDANVHAVSLDLNRIVALVAPAENIPHSKLDLSVQAKGPFAHPTADVAVAGTMLRDVNKPQEQIHANIQAHVDPKKVSAKLDVGTDAGKITLDAALPYITDPKVLLASTLPVSLKVEANVKTLAELYDTIGFTPPPGLAALETSVKLSVALSGTGRAPLLKLEIDGDGMQYGPMKDASLRAKVQFQKSVLDASLTLALGKQGEGALDGDGKSTADAPAGQIVFDASLPVVLARMMGPGSLRDKVGAQAPLNAHVKLQGIALASLPLSPLGVPALVDTGTLDGQLVLGGVVGDPTLRVALDGKGIKRGVVDHVDLGVGLESYGRATQVSALVSIEKSPLVSLKAHANHDLGAFLANADLKSTLLDATALFPGFELNKLEAVIPGLAGNVNGKVLVSGTLAAPKMNAHVALDRLAFGKTVFDKFTIDGSYEASGIKASLNAHEPSGGSMKGMLALAGGSLDASIEADKLALDFESNSDSIPVRRLKGALDIRLTAKGSPKSPVVNGYLALDKTTLAVVADPREITDLALRVDIAPGLVTLKTLSGKLGPGKFDVDGQAKMVGLVPQVIDVHVKTHELPAVQNPIAVAVDTKVDVHGEKQGNALVGTIKITNGTARLPSLTNIRSLQDTGDLKDVVYVDARARRKVEKHDKAVAKADAGQSMDVNIDAKLPGPFHIRSEEVQVDLKGDLGIKVHGPTVSLNGQIQALNGGRLTLFGKRYDIEHLRVGFDGSAVIDPLLDVKITRQLDAALIGVEVNGSGSKPKVHFFSDPPVYTDSQVILAILGSDPGQPQDNTPIGDKVGGAVSGLIVGQIKNQIAPHLPIDVIKIDVGDQTNFSQTRLEVGKYIRNNVYVSYVHQFGQLLIGTRPLSANEGNVEYRFKRNYAVDLTIGDAPEGIANLVWTLRY